MIGDSPVMADYCQITSELLSDVIGSARVLPALQRYDSTLPPYLLERESRH